MLAISVAGRDNKQLILIPHIKSVNKEIFKCNLNCPTYKKGDFRVWLLKIVLTLSGLFHYGYNGIRSKVIKLVPFLSKIIPPVFLYPRYGIEEGNWGSIRLKGTDHYSDWKLLSSKRFRLQLNDEQLVRGKIIREKMGIPEDAWFVCLHVREQGYLGRDPGHDIRNASISNYLPAIRFITQKGGYVIRLGDPTMTAIQPMENVLDYALSEFRSDLMDLYLMSHCRFFFASFSGPYNLAMLFHKPYCMVNATDLVYSLPCFSKCMFIPKRFFSKEKQRFISLKEELNSYSEIEICQDYIYVENSPEEILETIKEYMFFLENGKFYDTDRLQNEFLDLRRKRHEYLIKQNFIPNKTKDWLVGTLSAQGRIGNYYLKQCWEDTPYLQKLTNLYNGEE